MATGPTSRGSLGFILSGLLVFFVCIILFTNYQNLEGRRQLEKEMQTVIRTGHNKSADEMIQEIYEASEKLEMAVARKDIEIKLYLDQYGNQVVDARIDFKFSLDLLLTSVKIDLPIAESLTQIAP